MPKDIGTIWGIYGRGRVFRLQTTDDASNNVEWQFCETPCRFRKLAAAPQCVWSVGEDFKPYVFVAKSEVPIRVVDESYENQRWYPFVGFSHRLMPGDPECFSDGSKASYRPKEVIHLPSNAWQWEQSWMVDTNPQKTICKEGWQYANAFSYPFSAKKSTSHYVRRRRWIRSRRYFRTDQWVQIQLSDEYAVVDICVGGVEIPGQASGYLSVWCLTAGGKVLYRFNVHRLNPEGDVWYWIPTPDGAEFNLLSCNISTGFLWAVTWDGRLFARIGVDKAKPWGESWMELQRPRDLRVLTAALGSKCAWVLTVDGRIWFLRKPFTGDRATTINVSTEASDWLEMTHAMSSLCIGWNDQVYGIGLNDDELFFRTDVVPPDDLTGKQWAQFSVPLQETSDLFEFARARDDVADPAHAAFAGLTAKDFKDSGYSSPLFGRVMRNIGTGALKVLDEVWNALNSGKSDGARVIRIGHSYPNLSVRFTQLEHDNDCTHSADDQLAVPADEQNGELNRCTSTTSITSREPDPCLEPLQSPMSMSSHLASDDDASVPSDVEEPEISDVAMMRVCRSTGHTSRLGWMSLSVGQCYATNADVPRCWFGEQVAQRSCAVSYDRSAVWRQLLLRELHARLQRFDLRTLSQYVLAVERTAWVRCADAQLYYRRKWQDVRLELVREQDFTRREDSKLVLYFSKLRDPPLEYLLANFRCVQATLDESKWQVLVYVEGKRFLPLKLAFAQEQDQRNWTGWLSESARLIHDFGNRHRVAVWALTSTGEAMCGLAGASDNVLLWCGTGGHFTNLSAGAKGCIVYAVASDGQVWAWNSEFGGGAYHSEQCGQWLPFTDTKVETVWEHQRWSSLRRSYVAIAQATSGLYYPWSVDQYGMCPCAVKDVVRLPSCDWQWLDAEWMWDQGIQADDEGWCYAKTLGSERFYASKKHRNAYVRKRKWVRRMCLKTMGPWLPVGSALRIKCLSVQKVHSPEQPLYVWVVTENGELLCRTGVQLDQCITGIAWTHVACDIPVNDVAACNAHCVWIVGQDGAAYLRHCANVEDMLTCGWLHVGCPDNKRLVKISASDHNVWALDDDGNLYYRKHVSPASPEGMEWIFVYAEVNHVSLTADEQCWVVMDYRDPQVGKIVGVLARRVGINAQCPWGTFWELGDGANWTLVAAGGFLFNSAKNKCKEANGAIVC